MHLAVQEIRSMANDARAGPYATPREPRAVLPWIAAYAQVDRRAAVAVGGRR